MICSYTEARETLFQIQWLSCSLVARGALPEIQICLVQGAAQTSGSDGLINKHYVRSSCLSQFQVDGN